MQKKLCFPYIYIMSKELPLPKFLLLELKSLDMYPLKI